MAVEVRFVRGRNMKRVHVRSVRCNGSRVFALGAQLFEVNRVTVRGVCVFFLENLPQAPVLLLRRLRRARLRFVRHRRRHIRRHRMRWWRGNKRFFIYHPFVVYFVKRVVVEKPCVRKLIKMAALKPAMEIERQHHHG